ncbi:Heme d1 biosynthesis protein NirF [Caenispirillum salinarum AK4]|uniref:Heme d1 biosynthesis protein NirF n=1 Tax=Caenispirillum salinarum AK4 TaxID=1238182 RepID=K9HAL9_9PROT|nr:cytochrome D1 domain-containing protein [Caenispirillum salinarum]EKV27613.1 Heme d1 biosynthesis protein NirF [Caenispirillum salinarum AK4]
MRIRSFVLGTVAAVALATGAAAADGFGEGLRGTGDLGVVIERATGQVAVVDRLESARLATVEGLGDLSHASVVFGPSERYAYVFGRDGGLTKVDVLTGTIDARVVQSGNSIGGAISEDGSLVAVANYEPGGVKVFDAETLDLVADIPATDIGEGKRSKVVGLEDAPGNRFVFSLYDTDEIWIADFSKDRTAPEITKYPAIGRQPYDALVSEDGRWYLAGLFGEDGIAMLDLWNPDKGVRQVLEGYGRGEEALPVYKMPHLEGWAVAGGYAWLPAIGRHSVLVVDMDTWEQVAEIPVHGQPVFVMARPGGRHVWVNFALPDNEFVQVIDTQALEVVDTLEPGPGVLHMEFTPRGDRVWLSVRDKDEVHVYDTATRERLAVLPAEKPSGIFFTSRAHRIGL